MISTEMEIPDIPETLQEEAYYSRVENKVFVTRRSAHDPVFLSWMNRVRKQDSSVQRAVEEIDIIQQRRERERAGQTAIASGLQEDAINMEKTRALLVRAAAFGVSDIHILIRDTFTEIQFRMKGKLHVYDKASKAEGKLYARTLFQGLSSVKDSSYRPMEYQNAQITGDEICESLSSVRLVRGPAHPAERDGEFVVARLQYSDTIATTKASAKGVRLPYPAKPAGNERFKQMGFTEFQQQKIQEVAMAASGLVLVSGPTGSGKTTMINEMLKEIARQRPEMRQVTIEDPVEYPMPWAVQMAVTNAGSEDETGDAFAERLRVALRMDPDIILMGEIRGAGSALAALHAAMSGHLVLATLHVSDPYMAIDRLELMDPIRLHRKVLCDHRLIVGSVSTRLLPTLCPHCKQPLDPGKYPRRMMEILSTWGSLDKICQRNEEGCEECDFDGIKGRRAVAEFVRTDHELMNEFISNGTDAARKNMRFRKEGTSDKSLLYNVLREVFRGNVDPNFIRDVDTLVPRSEETG